MNRTLKQNQIHTRYAADRENTAPRRRRRRAGSYTIHALLLLIFFLGVAIVASLTVLFKIEAVIVIGSDRYDPAQLALASGVEIGDNLLRISPESISSSLLEGYPYIGSVEVHRRIPSTVEIIVTQAVPGGAVKEAEDYVLITKEGKVLERGTIFIPEHIPLVKGLDSRGIMPGQYLGSWERAPRVPDEAPEQRSERQEMDKLAEEHAKKIRESLQTLDYIYDAMEISGFTDITNMDITDPLNILIMYENRLLLELGSEAELPYKLEFVKTVIGRLEPDARGTIHAGNAKANVIYTPDNG